MVRSIVLAGIAAAMIGAPALAQVAAGPLADPTAAPASVNPGASTLAKTGRKRGHGAARKHVKSVASPLPGKEAASPAVPPDARNMPVSSADRRVNGDATDPISFGMKWNGANDSAEKTRVQNYDGNAEGTGAEVGLKLHF